MCGQNVTLCKSLVGNLFSCTVTGAWSHSLDCVSVWCTKKKKFLCESKYSIYLRRYCFNFHLFRNSVLIVDFDSVTWLIINPSVLCSPSSTFSSPHHGRGLFHWGGRGHCQCEGCTGDQSWSGEEHCRGAHQHLGAPDWPLCPVLHWDLGEMLHSCKGRLTSGHWLVPELWLPHSIQSEKLN